VSDITRWIRPGSRLDFLFELPASWAAEGDTITSKQITVVPVGATVTADAGTIVEDGAAVLVWVGGGQDEERATIRCTITTAAGRIDTKDLAVVVGYHDGP
jgi:hypothetical protein